MSNWPTAKLGEVATYERGLTYKKSDEIDRSSVVVLRANNIRLSDGSLELNDLRYLRPDFIVPSAKFVRKGSLLVCTASGSKSHLGKVALIDDDLGFAFGGFMGLVTPSALLLPNYLFHCMKSDAYAEFIGALSDGANINNLNWKQLQEYSFPLPPLDEQKRIVAKLDSVETDLRNLEVLLERRIEEEGRLAASIRASVMKPGDGWERKTLNDVASIFDGPHATPRKTDSGPWYLSIASLKDGEVDLSRSAHLAEVDFPLWTKRTDVRQGDTLFSYETRLGQAALWRLTEPAALGRRMGLLRPKSSILPEFLTASFLSPYFQEQIRERTSKGATVDRIPIAAMGHWLIWVPPIDHQHELMVRQRALADRLRAQRNISNLKSNHLVDLRASATSNILSGAA